MKKKTHVRCLVMIGVLLFVLCGAAVPAVAAAGENYLIMYVVGSDLESASNAASDNLVDLANKWDPAMGDVLIIYGGSKKTGWNNGIAITNLELLKADLADEVMGADVDEDGKETQHVLTRFSGADISTPAALTTSLRYAEEYRKSAGLSEAKVYLDLWNHGGGYTGFGQNEVTESLLSVSQLQSGIAAAGTTYDVILFDACLMASLEVADALHPYATYLIASEELVPGSGMNYEGFAAELSTRPEMSASEFGKVVIDQYLRQPDTKKTLSLIQLSQTPTVTAALNTLGSELYEIINDKDSLAMISSIYQNTQGYGATDDDPEPSAMDLYEFVSLVSAYATEGSNLRIAADNLLHELDAYVVYRGNDAYFNAANGITVAAPVEYMVSEVPDMVSFGRGGWYNYFSTYMSLAGAAAQPHAGYVNTTAGARAIQVTDAAGTAEVLANYLYQTNTGEFLILGDAPMQEKYVAGNNSVWTSVPTGRYEDPDWDGTWFVLKNESGKEVFATLTYQGRGGIENRSSSIYCISGNLIREVNTTTLTHPSVITAIVDTTNMTTFTLSVASKQETLLDGKKNLWGGTKLLPGDRFVPDIQRYNPETDTITTAASPNVFVFGKQPESNLVPVTLNTDNCYWMVELDDYLDDDVFYLEQPDMGSATPKPTKSPLMITGVFVGLGIATALSKKR